MLLQKLKEHKLSIVLLITLLAINLGTFLYISQEIVQRKQQSIEAKEIAKWLDLYQKNNSEEKLKTIPQFIKEENLESAKIELLNQFKAKGVDLENIKNNNPVSSDPKNKNSKIYVAPVAITIKGGWNNTASILEVIENNKNIISIDNLILDSALNGATTLKLTYSLYYEKKEWFKWSRLIKK